MKRFSMRFLAMICCALLAALPLAGCGQRPPVPPPPAESGPAAEAINIIATIFAPFDFARQIAGERANVTLLMSPGAESHSFEPSPGQMRDINNCDVFLYVGGQSDVWVDDILGALDNDTIRTVTLMDCVELLEEDEFEEFAEEYEDSHGQEKDAEEGDEPHEYDEHVWTSPRNAKRIVEKITEALCQADPANAAYYQQNAAAYQLELDALDAQFRQVVENAPRKLLLFGDRFPFSYFARDYGLRYAAAFPGCSTETEASAATLRRLIKQVKAEGVPVVFHIELSNQRVAQTIAEATGAQVRLLHAVHNISRDDFAAGATYLSLMQANVQTLKEALA